jgi:hypothetical protein
MAITWQGFYVNPHTFMLFHFHPDHWPCCKPVKEEVKPRVTQCVLVRKMCIPEKPGFKDRLKNRARKLDRRVSFLDLKRRRRQLARAKKMKDNDKALALEGDFEKKECMLLGRLPIELRLKIWEFVVGEQVLHLVCEPGRIGTYVCDEKCRTSVECQKWTEYDLANPFSAESGHGMEMIRKRAELLSLPLTCRSM